MISNKLLYTVSLLSILFIQLSGCNGDSETLHEGQERAVDNQQIENPPMHDIEVDDEELLRFVHLGTTLNDIQAETRQNILDLLREKELSVDVYNSINHALNMGFSLDDYNFSEEDIDKYYVVAELVTEIEETVDNKIEHALLQAGFTEERFLDLNIAMQHNMELMERSRNLIMEEEM